MEFKHNPVLLKECIEGLKIKPDGIYVDGTLGGGGHSKKILENLRNAIEIHTFPKIEKITCSIGGTIYRNNENILTGKTKT